MPRRIGQRGARTPRPYVLDEYIIDQNANNMLYGALVRSSRNFGKVKSVDTTILPAGYTLFTAADIPGENSIKTFNLKSEVFCDDFLHYKGQVIGILVGPSLKEVRLLAQQVMVVFDERYTTNEEEDATLSRRVIQTGIFKEVAESPKDTILSVDSLFLEEKNPIEELFEKSDFRVGDIWLCDDKRPSWLESTGVMTYLDGGVLNILTPTKWPAHLWQNIKTVTGLTDDKILIRRTKSRDESAGGTTNVTTLAAQCAIATLKTGKAVKLILRRDEERLFSPSIDVRVTQRTAVSSTGRVCAMEVYVEADAGWANAFSQEVADRLAIASSSPYYIKNLYIEVNVKRTKNPPSVMKSEGVEGAARWALERHLNHIAQVVNLMPQEVRLSNIDKAQSLFRYRDVDFLDITKALTNASGFDRKYSAYRLEKGHEKDAFSFVSRRGVALALGVEGAYFFGSRTASSDQKMEVTLTLDQKVIINSVAPNANCISLWKSIVSRTLKVDESQVSIASAQPGDEKFDAGASYQMPENLVANISLMTTLLKKCCQKIQKERFQLPLPITSKKGITKSMKGGWDKDDFCGSPFYAASFGAATVECNIDAVTKKVRLNAVTVVIDCGEVYSLKNVTNSVKRAVHREIELIASGADTSAMKIELIFVQSNKAPSQIGALLHGIIPAAFLSAVTLAAGKSVVTTMALKEDTL